MKETDKAWLAAALDFEGTIGLYKEKTNTKRGYTFTPEFIVANTKREIIEKVKSLCGSGYITERRYKQRKWNNIYIFTMHSNAIRRIIPQIKPYLIIKRQQVEVVLEALDLIISPSIPEENLYRLSELAVEISLLNKRGRVRH